MRSLSIVLTATLALTGLSACDKSKEGEGSKDKAAEAEGDKAEGEKADAKKEGDDKVAAAGEGDPEEGCIHEGSHEKKEDGEGCEHGAMPSESTGHFGAPFALSESKGLGAVLASGELPSEAVQVTGTVETVCQKMGCWMVIKDGDKQARVLVKDHAFAIPMDGKGKAAVVEGTLEAKELDEKNVAHLKKDGDDTLEGDGPREEIFLHATAVELAQNS